MGAKTERSPATDAKLILDAVRADFEAERRFNAAWVAWARARRAARMETAA